MQGEQVDQAQDEVLGQEVPGHVQHEAAPAQPGVVLHACTRDARALDGRVRPPQPRGQELAQGLHAVEGPDRVRADDLDAVGVHGQRVAVFAGPPRVDAHGDGRRGSARSAPGVRPTPGLRFAPRSGQRGQDLA